MVKILAKGRTGSRSLILASTYLPYEGEKPESPKLRELVHLSLAATPTYTIQSGRALVTTDKGKITRTSVKFTFTNS